MLLIKYDTLIDILIIRYQIIDLADPGLGYKKRDIHNMSYSSYKNI